MEAIASMEYEGLRNRQGARMRAYNNLNSAGIGVVGGMVGVPTPQPKRTEVSIPAKTRYK